MTLLTYPCLAAAVRRAVPSDVTEYVLLLFRAFRETRDRHGSNWPSNDGELEFCRAPSEIPLGEKTSPTTLMCRTWPVLYQEGHRAILVGCDAHRRLALTLFRERKFYAWSVTWQMLLRRSNKLPFPGSEQLKYTTKVRRRCYVEEECMARSRSLIRISIALGSERRCCCI